MCNIIHDLFSILLITVSLQAFLSVCTAHSHPLADGPVITCLARTSKSRRGQWRPNTVRACFTNICEQCLFGSGSGFHSTWNHIRSYRFGTTWGWVNNDRIFIFVWTILFNYKKHLSPLGYFQYLFTCKRLPIITEVIYKFIFYLYVQWHFFKVKLDSYWLKKYWTI